MTVRADLIELSLDALTALANPGFVKRAQKDIAEGRIPQIDIAADATVRARYEDGHQATLAPGGSLREAACTCPAAGLCRHRVTLVLAYQHWAQSATEAALPVSDSEAVWSPAEFDEAALAAALTPATLDQARRLAAARPVVRLCAWQLSAPTPTAHLPLCTVRFFSRRTLSHARCDCRLGGSCAHVAVAVWAFRQAGGLADAVIELLPRDATAGAAGLDAEARDVEALALRFLRRLWLDGSSQDWAPLEADFTVLRDGLSRLGWNWPGECLDELRGLVLAQAARSSRFDPQRLLELLAELAARIAAARAAAEQAVPLLPASQILGIGVRGEVALDHLKLVSLGLQCWRDDTSDGARVLFADPDTLAVTVLERSWLREPGQVPTPIVNRRVAGQALRQLAGAQVVTRGAKRRANGLLDIPALARQTSVLPLSALSWEGIGAPLRQPGGAALARHLRAALPDFVRPRQAIAHVHVLPVAEIGEWGWDAAAQTLHATVLCCDDAAQAAAGDWVQLALAHDAATPGAVDTLAAALADVDDPPWRIAGPVQLCAGAVCMTPLAVLTRQRAIVLQADGVSAQTLPPLAWATSANGLSTLLAHVLEELALWARQGIRHQTASALARVEAQAGHLESRGLAGTAALLRRVAIEWRESSEELPRWLATLVLLLHGLLADAAADEPRLAGTSACAVQP